jgi:hypothetical protein
MSFRLACRMLRRSPWFAATSIGTVAVALAVAATAFAVVDGVLFKPLPTRIPTASSCSFGPWLTPRRWLGFGKAPGEGAGSSQQPNSKRGARMARACRSPPS